MTTINTQRLQDHPFLEGISPDVIARLAETGVEKRFRTGQVIVQEGAASRELYLVLEGEVEIVMDRDAGETAVATRGVGEVFGEIGFVTAAPRMATVQASSDPTRLLEFSESRLRSLMSDQPLLLYNTIRVLSARLREADQRLIADLQRKNLELAQAYRELQEAQAGLLEKERLEREMELARELQQSILPHEFPEFLGVRCAACSRPARQVGGDFYDVISLSEGRLGLVMADVSDKGLASALYMALTRSLIRAEARHSDSPRQVLLNIHELLMEISQSDMFVTVFYGVLDPLRRTLVYARAGHDRPLLYRPGTGECRFLTAGGIVLGLIEDVSLEEVSVDLCPGDLLVLYTDGIPDANSPDDEFFGVERLRQAICAGGELGAQDLCGLVFEQVDAFQAEGSQYDDMALLVVKLGQ